MTLSALAPAELEIKKPRINPFVISYMIALVLLAATGYYVANYEIKQSKQSIQEKYFATDLNFYDLPRINLTLASTGANKNGKLRMDLSLEVADKDMEKLQDFQPRIMDTIIQFMHQYDAEDIKPKESIQELHERLLAEINLVSKPVPIHSIVFRQFVVQ